ncbi:hypothetical protein VNI00_016815 [Paramarasmius palmivorus]|uniref:F-box domain-containing protein n=1 Tax=Paramarasmius palmivorus TaxID=297713 RepID=A0AAW0BDX0_9AGAR
MSSFQPPISSTETRQTCLEQEHEFFSIPPARRVPAEILEKIFSIICLPEFGGYSLDIDENREEKTIPSVAPTLALSQVSSRWRQTAKGFPKLWSSIKVCLSDFTVVGMGAEPLLGLYLTRSQEHPVDLKFVYFEPHRDPSIRDVLLPHLRHVVKLDISKAEPQERSIPVPEWLAQGLSDAAKLAELRLDHNHLHYIRAPYHQLTSLQILNVICEPLTPTLRFCTKLRALQITGSSRILPSRFDHIQLPHLRHLSLSCPHETHFTWHINHLTLPSLVSLEIISPSLRSFARTLELIHRSSCRLSQLVLKMSVIDVLDAALTEFLWACPELSQLQVHILKDVSKKEGPKTFTHQLLDVLSHSPRAVAPKLVELSVLEEDEAIDSESADTLLDMSETRLGAFDAGLIGELVPSPRWDLRFGGLSVCTADVLEAFNARLEKLAEKGFACSIEWAETLV